MSLSPQMIAEMADCVGLTLLHSLWQGVVIFGVVGLALRGMRGRSAALRHALCLVGMAMLTAAVLTTAWTIRPMFHRVAQDEDSAVVRPEPETPALESGATVSPSVMAKAPAAEFTLQRVWWRERLSPMLPAVAAIWIAGVLLLSIRHLVGLKRLRGLANRAVPVSEDLQRIFMGLLDQFGRHGGVRLVQSAEALAPMVAGFLKPLVVLPLGVVTGLSARELEAILAHELAHFVRRDVWSNHLQIAMETCFFYHPVVWWLGGRARAEREMAADDLAIRICSDRRTYVGALVKLAEFPVMASPGVAANGGSLLSRIQRIVQPEPVETLPGAWSLGVPVVLAVLAVATVFPSLADDPKPASPDANAETSLSIPAASFDAKATVADAFQLDDKAKREAAIERVRAAMLAGDPNSAREAVRAFVQLAPIEFDKASFRPAVRLLLQSNDAITRATAASAFTMTGADAEDSPRIFALADDTAPEVRDALTYVIVSLTKHDLRDPAASEAILKLMANLPRDSRSVAHAMWGVKLSPELEAKVLEFCKEIDHASNSSVGYNFFYGTLSTQANKSEASCKRLIELLAHPDTTNIAGRSAWGLQQGVDRTQFELVADAMVKVIEARSDGYLRSNALRCLQTYGNAAQVPAVKALLDKPGATGELRKALEETVATLAGRTANVNVPLEEVAAVVNDQTLTSAQLREMIEPAERDARRDFRGDELTAKLKEIRSKAIQEWTAQARSGSAEKVPSNSSSQPTTTEPMKLKNPILRSAAAAAVAATSTISAEEATALREKVGLLEKRLAQIENGTASTGDREKLREENKLKARQRGAQDRQQYKSEELQDIEALYQVANKNWRTEEARTSLKKLLEKYDRANRTGCATLYMGQMSEGQERLDYLTRAVEKFSDCYYFDGCQVGGYGRYVLALTLWEKGEKAKARGLLAELKTTYKDAIDHRGRPMSEMAAAAEREFDAKP